MKFRDITSLLGWAFQMQQTEIISKPGYGERISKSFGDLTMEERHKQAVDILAKVSRLKLEEQVCIVSKHTGGNTKAVHDAAYLLPNWPRPMTLALVRRWAGYRDMSQREIAEMCGCSQKLVSLREVEAIKILDDYYWRGCDVLEYQLLPLLGKRLICEKACA